MKRFNKMQKAIILSMLCLSFSSTVCASDSEEYITITVDAEDDNENLMYSLDSTDPASFSSSNIFRIPAGTSHTIYVKDEAGNITSQEYSPEISVNTTELTNEVEEIIASGDSDTQDISIDLEIGNNDDYEYLTDSPAEPGEGTVHDKTKTEGNDDNAQKLFYTVTTAEGNVFYMVIDQNQNEDNVYFLNAVTNSDLEALAVEDENTNNTVKNENQEQDNLLEALSSEQGNTSNEDNLGIDSKSESGSNSRSNSILILVLIAIGGALYYYFKVYKNKKDEAMDVMDAMNMEDFAPEEQEDDEEAEFEFADEEKQAYLDRLINDDEEPDFDIAANNDDIYATSHIEDYQDYEDVNELQDNILYDEELVADFESEYDEELDGEEE